MGRLAKPLDDLGDHYDVIIIGSGYGGGVSASRLARAGKRVAVLERGREILTGEFPARFPDMRHEFQVTSNRIKTGKDTSLFDIRLGDDMHVLVGCGLGGGSLINAGVALRPDERVFADPRWPHQVADDGLLDEGFSRAAEWLAPAQQENAADLTKVAALAASGAAFGKTPIATDVLVSFSDRVNAAGVAQPACTLCGDCCAGCNVGAKNTVALTYLPDAVRHGADLFTHIKVSHLSKTLVSKTPVQNGSPSKEAGGGWIVHYDRLDSDAKPAKNARNAGRLSVSADTVILSAGTLGSTEILLRSRDDGLELSQCLGERFSANGDIIAFAYGADVDVNAVGVGHPAKVEIAPVGASVSAHIEFRDDDNLDYCMNVQEGVMPSALAPALPLLFVPNGRLLGALKSLVAGVYNGPFKHLQTFFAVSHDSASGKLSIKKDQLSLSWPGAAAEPVHARMDKTLDALASKVGGSYVKNPLAGTVMGHQPATAHPLGGCSVGTDSAHGVVNHKCQVFDARVAGNLDAVHDGLYVVDGSIIPRSLGVNPLLTITALAERVMILMAGDHDLKFDVAPVSIEAPVPPEMPGALPKVGE